jgi:hypothetical protein
MGAKFGFSNQERSSRDQVFQTVQKFAGSQGAADCLNWSAYTVNVAALTVLAGSTTQAINVVNTAIAGDFVQFLSGLNIGMTFRVSSATAGTITIEGTMPNAPAALDTLNVRRAIIPNTDSKGDLIVTYVPTYPTLVEFQAIDFTGTPITSAAWVLIHTMTVGSKEVQITNQSGGAFKIRRNGALVIGLIVPGEDVIINLSLNLGDTLELEAVNAGFNTNAGNLFINFFN